MMTVELPHKLREVVSLAEYQSSACQKARNQVCLFSRIPVVCLSGEVVSRPCSVSRLAHHCQHRIIREDMGVFLPALPAVLVTSDLILLEPKIAISSCVKLLALVVSSSLLFCVR